MTSLYLLVQDDLQFSLIYNNKTPRLDMGRFVLEPTEAKDSIYDLMGVTKHMGGQEGGHYIAYAKSSVNGEW